MQQNYSGRVILILAVLFATVWGIFPNWDFRHPALRPGIDMVGGTSLLYEIKVPENTQPRPNLAEDVMAALKKRVDPQGVRNLIWRPEGNTRLEIQMPMSEQSKEAAGRREAFAAAQRQLEATNVRPNDVLAAVEQMSGAARDKRLDELAMGNAQRRSLFTDLAQTYDKLSALKKEQKDFKAQAVTQRKYDQLKTRIDETNLPVSELQGILDSKEKDAKLAALKTKSADFPQRLEAINQFATAYQQFSEVKDSLDDAASLKRLLRGSGVLEFHILANDLPAQEVQAMEQRLEKKGPRPEPNDTVRWYPVDRPSELPHNAGVHEYNGKYYALAYITPGKQLVNGPGLPRWSLQSATPAFDPNGGGRIVDFKFDTQGGQLFGQLTGANINHPLAIVLDDKIISAPNINSRINGNGQISGDYSEADQTYLVSTLNAGSLPAQLGEQPISERTVGPQLGSDNLRAGLISCILGLAVVCLFMICYYFKAGVVAAIAVIMNVIMILGAMAWINATFTLPAIAGLVLTIGIAVDANVLIFERLREEEERGLSLRMALHNAYKRAFSAILDSNVTTAITCVVLYMIGTEEVKGFGLTLLLGLISSLFTALFVTRTIFGIWGDYFGLKRLSSLPLTFPRLGKLLHPNVDWMGKIWFFVGLSVVLIALGWTALIVKFHQGQMLDIEFRSGTSVQFDLKQPTPIEQVRKMLASAGESVLPSPTVVAVGSEHKSYEVVTTNEDSNQVKTAILDAIPVKLLNTEQPSEFAGAREKIGAVLGKQVVPLTGEKPLSVHGWKPVEALSYRGGAAIILDNLQPPLSAVEIKSRLERQQLQPRVNGESPRYRDFTVVSPNGPDAPSQTAVILFNDTNLPYDARNANRWEDEVAGPMWQLLNEALLKPASLQKVSNFDAQIAGEMQQDAFLALVLSNLIIMAYIWLRFGNLKFGAAAVAGMVHDTVLLVGIIGLSHYIGHTRIGQWLMIEPFRINLTMVAGILTIMGYSLVDTIVVFDRIRENRGKLGHLDRQVINDSINQTLSRTVLTAGTTMMTVLVMYIFGGPGIHGFTFALLIGILIGTYSSIAIASPILLLGNNESVPVPGRRRGSSSSAVERVGA
jgi:SecD/SecF fusion protein